MVPTVFPLSLEKVVFDANASKTRGSWSGTEIDLHRGLKGRRQSFHQLADQKSVSNSLTRHGGVLGGVVLLPNLKFVNAASIRYTSGEV